MKRDLFETLDLRNRLKLNRQFTQNGMGKTAIREGRVSGGLDQKKVLTAYALSLRMHLTKIHFINNKSESNSLQKSK